MHGQTISESRLGKPVLSATMKGRITGLRLPCLDPSVALVKANDRKSTDHGSSIYRDEAAGSKNLDADRV